MVSVFIRDLIFETKIRSTADSLGIKVAVSGRLPQWIQRLSEDPPTLVIVDMNAGEEAIDAVRAATAANGSGRNSVNIIAFAAHVDEHLFQGAREAGASTVMVRSRFSQELPGILESYVRSI